MQKPDYSSQLSQSYSVKFTIWEVLISKLYWDEQDGKSVKLLNENQPFYIMHATRPIQYNKFCTHLKYHENSVFNIQFIYLQYAV